MFINESTLSKLMNGTPLEEEEHVKVMTALAEEKQRREEKEQANEKLADDIIWILQSRGWDGATLSAIKACLVQRAPLIYEDVSESKIWQTMYNNYMRFESGSRYKVAKRKQKVRSKLGTTKRNVYYIMSVRG